MARSQTGFRGGVQAPQVVDVSDPITASTYTVKPDDDYLIFSSAGAQTVTVPPDTNDRLDAPIGATVNCTQNGVGQVTFAAGAGVTILSAGSKVAIAAQYDMVTLVKEAANIWKLFGALA